MFLHIDVNINLRKGLRRVMRVKIFINYKRKSYIAGITKLINSITKLIDQKRSFSNFSKFDQYYIQNIRDLTTKIIGSESDHNVVQPELEICTEQEFRVIQIRNAISSYFENKDVSPIT